MTEMSGVITAGENGNITALHFSSLSRGAFATKMGEIYRTQDGGATWAKAYGPNFYLFHDIRFTEKGDTGYAVGAGTGILRTVDGGASWTYKNSGIRLSGEYVKVVEKIFVKNGKTAWVVVDDGYIYKTVDAGESWSRTTMSIPSSMHFGGKDSIFATMNTGSVYLSLDNGDTWTTYGTPAPAWSFGNIFYREGNNMILHRKTSDGAVVMVNSPDKVNWSVTPYQPSSASVTNGVFFNFNEGWTTSSAGIHYTTNGGINWTLSDASIKSSVIYFHDFSHGWVAQGSKIYRYGVFPPVSTGSITEPLSGSTVYTGQTIYFKWKIENTSAVTIEYSDNNGYTWNVIAADLSADNARKQALVEGQYAWTVPSDLYSIIVRIKDKEGKELSKISLNIMESTGVKDQLSNKGYHFDLQNKELRMDKPFTGSVEVYDINGKVYMHHQESSSDKINFRELTSGFYLIRLVNDEGERIWKVAF
ncbi:hypothetical protein MYP_3236 [Sporocytophaga myxococcoides]|uniref:Photosynthesis system II assembly factor Ycf48/Hcf136-like domain-containing protein n=2 Tax=Sporocytophaga myxococcoides TaxID=153721 RepID=A0A098LHV4_9BACT|nr:hypothetical protein MYP_3236 [Sporocytophaga myxococcoides]